MLSVLKLYEAFWKQNHEKWNKKWPIWSETVIPRKFWIMKSTFIIILTTSNVLQYSFNVVFLFYSFLVIAVCKTWIVSAAGVKVWPNILCAGFHKPWKFNLWSKTDAGFKVSARVYRILSSGGGVKLWYTIFVWWKKILILKKKVQSIWSSCLAG